MSEVASATPAAPLPSAPAAPVAPAEGADPAAQNTGEQATPTAPEGEQKPDTGQDPEKRGKSRYERRLDRAYKRAAEAQARAEFFEKQWNEAKASQQPAADPAAPRLEQFKDIEEYATAKAKYESDRILKDHQARQQGETQKQQQARLSEQLETVAERGEGKYDDWMDKVGDIKPTTPWAVAAIHAENGEDVLHHLGSNLKEAQRINALPAVLQILEIGRISAKLAAEPPKPKTPSRAPAPITPVTGTAPAASPTPSENDDMKTWMAKRQKQVHGSRK